MKTTLTWIEKDVLPKSDVYIGLVAIVEPNRNYEVYKQLGIPTKEFTEMVLPAVYVVSENKWMSAGVDVTENVKYWVIPTYPKK
jgi:hypothetical protein